MRCFCTGLSYTPIFTKGLSPNFASNIKQIEANYAFIYLRITADFRYLEYSISQTLLYLEQYIRSLGHLALDQSKKLSVYLKSQYFEFLPMLNKLSGPLSSFLLLSQTSSSQISLFSTSAST